MRDLSYSIDLLAWYDVHARDLPWRILPHSNGIPDPYRIWLSEVMLQQTTVAAVKAYFHKFTDLWPRVDDLANAADADVMAAWAGLGYYARARNLLKCARTVTTEHNGIFPTKRADLQTLPGIGPYTSAAISAIAFDQPETVVDGNVERVMARLFDVHEPLPGSKPKLTELATNLTPAQRPGDYAQAVMDLGATICTPRSPKCSSCPLNQRCAAHANGTAAELPKKTPKTPKPTRYGIAYVARRANGDVYLQERPAKGLLGGMMGWPGTDWTVDAPAAAPPFQENWQSVPGDIRHTFTHFHLVVQIMLAENCENNSHFTDVADFDPTNLPTVMRKIWFHALSAVK